MLGKMSSHSLESILFLCSILAIGNSANILGVFPIKAKSHFFFDFTIMKTLADSGHNVTMICPFPEVGPSNNLRIIDHRNDSTAESKSRFANSDFLKTSVLKHWQNAKKHLIQDCQDFTSSRKIQELLSSDIKFDIMFVHMLPMYECYLPIAEQYEIPVIGTITFRQFMSIDEAVGNPHHLTLPFTSTSHPQIMTFFQRLRNTGFHLLIKAFYEFEISAALEDFFQQYYPMFVKDNFDHRISLLFSNNHPSVLPKPLAPNVIEVGGIHLGKPNPLPEKFEKFIANSKEGVILFSMGSIADHEMVNERIQNILRDTFAEIPQRVIWKFGKQVANVTDNVYITDWIPQFDILTHPNVKIFISHCGISGTYEAIYTSTPMILLPLFGDQPANAALLSEMEVGVHVDITILTKETLLKAIDSIIKEEKYARNMDHLSNIFKDRPMSPKESVIYWTEYILRYKGAHHLNVEIRNIPLFSYLLLDILIGFVFIIILVVYAIRFCCRKYHSELAFIQ